MRTAAASLSDRTPRTNAARVLLVFLALAMLSGLSPISLARARQLHYPAVALAKRVPDSAAEAVRARTSPAVRAHAAARATLSEAALGSQLGHQMGIAGRGSGALVYDITAGSTLYSLRAAQPHPPASIEKLYTSTAALMRLGPSARLNTTVLGSGRLGEDGVWEGNLYLRGGGDPTFGSSAFVGARYGGQGASVFTLVQQLVRSDGIRRITGRILGDESWFDSLRGEPSSGYAFDPWLEGRLSALAFDRGETGPFDGPHAPAAYAARQLLKGLRRAGVKAPRGSGPAPSPTPAGSRQLAVVGSPPLSTLLGLMLPHSDNFFAETLVKDLGADFGGAGSTAAGAAVVRESIASLRLYPQIVDGSGLSREDRTSPEAVVSLLRRIDGTADGAVLRGDLAVAGRSGTLSERMRHSYAEGRCQGKTGTLEGVSNLAGYCSAIDGHLIAFAFFDDGIETYAAHSIQDAMAEAIARY